jgi:hypothetical protein
MFPIEVGLENNGPAITIKSVRLYDGETLVTEYAPLPGGTAGVGKTLLVPEGPSTVYVNAWVPMSTTKYAPGVGTRTWTIKVVYLDANGNEDDMTTDIPVDITVEYKGFAVQTLHAATAQGSGVYPSNNPSTWNTGTIYWINAWAEKHLDENGNVLQWYGGNPTWGVFPSTMRMVVSGGRGGNNGALGTQQTFEIKNRNWRNTGATVLFTLKPGTPAGAAGVSACRPGGAGGAGASVEVPSDGTIVSARGGNGANGVSTPASKSCYETRGTRWVLRCPDANGKVYASTCGTNNFYVPSTWECPKNLGGIYGGVVRPAGDCFYKTCTTTPACPGGAGGAGGGVTSANIPVVTTVTNTGTASVSVIP